MGFKSSSPTLIHAVTHRTTQSESERERERVRERVIGVFWCGGRARDQGLKTLTLHPDGGRDSRSVRSVECRLL